MHNENYQKLKLGALASEISERVNVPSESGYDRFVGLEHLDSGSLRVTRWGSTADLVSAMKLFKKGDILFGRRNAYLKRASIAEFDGVCSGDIIVLRSNKDIVLSEYLILILNKENLWNYAISYAAGSMSKRVKWRDLSKYEVTLPSLEKQKQIADIIWSLENEFAATMELSYWLGQLKKSAMKKFVNTGTTEEDIGYGALNLHEIFELRRELIDTNDENTTYIALEHIEQGTGKLLGTGKASDAVSTKTKFQKGDILFGKLRPYLKKYWLAEFDGVCSTEILVFKPNSACLPVYGFYIVQQQSFVDYAVQSSCGTKMPRTNWEKLSAYMVELPTLEEQQKAITVLNDVDKSIDSVQKHAMSINEYKKQLLNDLL